MGNSGHNSPAEMDPYRKLLYFPDPEIIYQLNAISFTTPGRRSQRRWPDITRAKELLGWKPKVALEERIGKMIASQ